MGGANATKSNEETVTIEQVTEDVPLPTSELVNEEPTMVEKTRRKISKTYPMKSDAKDSSSKKPPLVNSSTSLVRHAGDLGKQSLVASLKVCALW